MIFLNYYIHLYEILYYLFSFLHIFQRWNTINDHPFQTIILEYQLQVVFHAAHISCYVRAILLGSFVIKTTLLLHSWCWKRMVEFLVFHKKKDCLSLSIAAVFDFCLIKNSNISQRHRIRKNFYKFYIFYIFRSITNSHHSRNYATALHRSAFYKDFTPIFFMYF